MPVQFSDLVRIAGMSILLSVLWAASIAFTYWDTHRRGLMGGKAFFWWALVALLPFIGFLAYIVFRATAPLFSPSNPGMELKSRRETALKRPAPRRNPLPTLIASNTGTQAVSRPNKAEQAGSDPPAGSAKYIFTVASGADHGKEFTVEYLPARIGRGSEVTIPLDLDLGISRKHAEIYQLAGLLRIRDLQSAHGTYVNGSRIEESSLKSGDRIQVGLTVLAVKIVKE